MTDKQKQIDPIPTEFASYEEASDFWESHDTTDYPDLFEPVAVEAEFRRRRFEVEVDEDLMTALSAQAHERGMPIGRLVNDLLWERIRSAA